MAIVLKTLSDSRQAQQDLAKLRESVDKIQVSADKVNERFSTLTKTIAVGIAAASSVKAYTQISDSLTNMQNKLKNVSDSQDEFNAAWRGTKRIAAETRAGLQNTVVLYGRLKMATTELGYSQRQTLDATRLISKSIASSGATAQEARAGIQQLGQALGRGKFSGDELKSVMENTLALATDIAKGLGMSVGQMQALGYEGKISAKMVLDAVKKMGPEIEKRFANMAVTYSSAFGNLKDSILALFDSVQKSVSGTTEGFAAKINRLALHIWDLANDFDLIMLRIKIKTMVMIGTAIMFFMTLKESAKNAGENILAIFSGFTLEDFLPSLAELPSTIVGWFRRGYEWVSQLTDKFVQSIRDAFAWLKNILVDHSIVPEMIKKIIFWFKQLLKVPVATVKLFGKIMQESFSSLQFVAPLALGLGMLTKYRMSLLKILGMTTAIAMLWKGIQMHRKNEIKLIPAGSKDKIEEYRERFKGSKQLTAALDKVNQALDVLKESEETRKAKERLRGSAPGELLLGKQSEDWSGHTKGNKGLLQKIHSAVGDRSTFARVLRQAFGLPEKYEGQLFGRKQDTKSYVGLGPQKDQRVRFPGHDIVNAMPVDKQLPFITGFAGMIALGIVGATKAGIVRNALLLAIGGAWVAATVSSMQGTDIQESLFRAVQHAFKGITFGIDRLVGTSALAGVSNREEISLKGILSDIQADTARAVKLLAVFAGISMLFKPGRAFAGNALGGLAMAPTNMMVQGERSLYLASLEPKVKQLEDNLAAIPIKYQHNLAEREAKQEQYLRELSNKISPVTQATIGTKEAKEAVARQDRNMFGPANVADVDKAISAKAAVDEQKRLMREEMPGVIESQKKKLDKLKGITEPIKKTLKEGAEAFATSIRRSFAAAGGALGAALGFQWAQRVTDKMAANTPAWQKVGITIAGTMGGQAIGAGLGVSVGTVIAAILMKSLPLAILAAGLGLGYLVGSAIVFILKKEFPRLWEGVGDFVGGAVDRAKADIQPDDRLSTVAYKNIKAGYQSLLDVTGYNEWAFGIQKSVGDSMEEGANKFVNFLIPSASASDLGAPNAESLGGGPGGRYKRLHPGELVQGPDLIYNLLKSGDFGRAFEEIKKMVESQITKWFPDLPKSPDGSTGTGTGDDKPANTRQYRLEQGGGEDVIQEILDRGIKSGIAGLNIEDVQSLGATTTLEIAKVLDEAEALIKLAAKPGAPPFLLKWATDAQEDLNNIIRDKIGVAQAEGKVRKDLEITPVKFNDALDHMNSVLPKLAVSFDDLQKIPTKVMSNLVREGEALYKREQDILTSNIPVAEMQERLLGIQKEREQLEGKYLEQLSKFRGPLANLRGTIEALGMDINLEGLRALDAIDMKALQESFGIFKQASDRADDPNATPEQRVEAARLRNRTQTSVSEMANRAAIESLGTPYERLQKEFENFGITLEKSAYNLMTGVDKALMTDYLASLRQRKAAMEAYGTAAAQEQYDAMITAVERAIAAKGYDYRAAAENAGNVLASDLGEGVRSGLKSLFKGDYLEDPKRFILDFAERMADGIIDSFVEGLTAKFTGPEGAVTKFGQEIGSKVFDIGAGLFGGRKKDTTAPETAGTLYPPFAPAVVSPLIDRYLPSAAGVAGVAPGTGPMAPVEGQGENPVVGAVGDLAAPLQAIAGSTNTTAATSMQSVSSLQSMNTAILGQSSLVGNILTTVSTGIMAITGALTASATAGAIGGAAGGFGSLGTGMASGGLVFGPGTGTSDSIPALLSNKEFVVNAKATKKNLRLLTAINEGRVKRMAGGGLAAYASLLSSPSYVPARSGGGGQMGNQQVINLNITGDISRQTKSEIVRMLPLIAEGVNGHNKERGYRNQAF